MRSVEYIVAAIVNYAIFWYEYKRGQAVSALIFLILVGVSVFFALNPQYAEADVLGNSSNRPKKTVQNVTVVNLDGPYKTTASDKYWIDKVSSATGVPIHIVKIINRGDFAPKLNTLDSWQKKAFRLKAWLVRQNVTNAGVVKNPPILDALGRRYVAGMSVICDPDSGWSIIFGQDINEAGNSRVFNTEVTEAHEVGHLNGAFHYDHMPITIMHPTSAHPGFIQSVMEFSPVSITQMKRCMERRGYKI